MLREKSRDRVENFASGIGRIADEFAAARHMRFLMNEGGETFTAHATKANQSALQQTNSLRQRPQSLFTAKAQEICKRTRRRG